MAAGFAQTGTTHSLTTGPSQLYQIAKSPGRSRSSVLFSSVLVYSQLSFHRQLTNLLHLNTEHHGDSSTLTPSTSIKNPPFIVHIHIHLSNTEQV
jgi:hypothetical protein